MLSADPRRVPEAVVLDEMSYNEAIELAYFGAKVLHPHTMAPALEGRHPDLDPQHLQSRRIPGTKIHRPDPQTPREHVSAVKGFSTVDKVALINLEGTGMIGVPGVAQRLFGALKDVGVSVVMISQASSEHSICFAVPEAQGTLAKKTVEKRFFAEIHHGQIQIRGLLPGCSILAAVGDDMVHAAGVAAKFFGALGKAGVNIRAIAQGSSERNISVVIDQKDSHARASRRALGLLPLGPDLIGGHHRPWPDRKRAAPAAAGSSAPAQIPVQDRPARARHHPLGQDAAVQPADRARLLGARSSSMKASRPTSTLSSATSRPITSPTPC